MIVVPITCYLPSAYTQMPLYLPLMGFTTLSIHAGFAIYFPELFANHLRSTGAGFCFNAGWLVASPVLVFSSWLRALPGMNLQWAITLMSLLFIPGILVVLVLPENRSFPDPQDPHALSQLIERRGRVDACFRGIGINGHVAFNEPPEPGVAMSVEEFAALPTRRRREMQAAAGILGRQLLQAGVPDGMLADDTATRKRVTELVRKFRPTLLLAHAPEDYHPDHRAASAMAEAVSWFSASVGQKTRSRSLATAPQLWWMDTLAMNGFQPAFYVDISSFVPAKERMLACHRSQLARAEGRDFAPLSDLTRL